MNEECLLPPAHEVLLLLGYVVGHIVDDLHVKVVWCGVEGLRKCLQREREREEWSGDTGGSGEYTVVCVGGGRGMGRGRRSEAGVFD